MKQIANSIRETKKVTFRLFKEGSRVVVNVHANGHQERLNLAIGDYKFHIKSNKHSNRAKVEFKLLKSQGFSKLFQYLTDLAEKQLVNEGTSNIEIQISFSSFADHINDLKATAADFDATIRN